MLPGLKNFQSVKKNQWLANDLNGEIKAGEKGRIFMPLYQSKGNDGFFLIREVRWLWLNFSAVLRRTKFHRLLHLFPGVTMENGKKYTLVVNTHIARWFVREFFHLMGFRMKRRAGKYTIFTKREFDVNRPVL